MARQRSDLKSLASDRSSCAAQRPRLQLFGASNELLAADA